MRILIFLVLLLIPAMAHAEVIDSAMADGKPQVVAAVDPLILREKPSLDSAVAVEAWIPPVLGDAAPMPIYVYILDDTGPATTIAGRPDRWVRIALTNCFEGDCSRRIAGWVPDSHLGFDDRFRPLSLDRSETVVGYSRQEAFVYRIGQDGRFTRWSAPCVIGACGPLPAGTPARCSGDDARSFCVETGTMHRYRDLVVAETAGKGQDGAPQRELAVIAGPEDEFCAFKSERNKEGRRCVRPDPAVAAGDDPRATLGAVMAARRSETALVAADLLNLRAKPSVDGEVVGALPRGSGVKLLDGSGPAIEIGGKSDRWVKVMVMVCEAYMAFGQCELGAVGWTVDGFLAYEDRLKPVTEWRESKVGGYVVDSLFSYSFAADGTVKNSVYCGDFEASEPGSNDNCERTGRLYRYRNMMVARFATNSIWETEIFDIDDDGKLCLQLKDMNEVMFSPRCEP